MATKNKKGDTFDLLSTKTKIRIRDLIEKRLTPQTIVLFAQEYESYDLSIRVQINQYIRYLMELEYEEFLSSTKALSKGEITFGQKQVFEERQRSLKTLQNLLKSKETNILHSTKNDKTLIDSKQAIAEQKKFNFGYKESAKEAKKTEDLMRKRLDEMEKRERDEASGMYSISKKPLLVNPKQETAKIARSVINDDFETNIAKTSTEKIVKNIDSNNYNSSIVNKNKFKDFDQVRTRITDDKEYKKEQLEKERLWKQLYGNLKKNNDENEFANSTPEISEKDKQFNINVFDDKRNYFFVGNVKITYFEVADPKSRNFIFWQKWRRKKSMFTVESYFQQTATEKFRLKILKLRNKFMSKNGINEESVIQPISAKKIKPAEPKKENKVNSNPEPTKDEA
ncbi:hypothetical protein [Spiroplasma endosymbiont of Labia minor]|uniref:hypothetical protein n=1 Tax=Spiroplasma endosymbiont of Labia minor TaxID=3066305 RepID=UPI0030D154D7